MSRSAVPHQLQDWDIAGRTVFGEARSEAYEGMVGVAWVIRNRVERRSWYGRTVKDVCLKDRQFSCWNPGDPNRVIITNVAQDNAAFRRCLAVVALVLAGDIADPTNGATNYFTTAKPSWADVWPPKWSDAMFFAAELGAHKFFVEMDRV